MSADSVNMGCRRYSMVCDNCGVREVLENHRQGQDDRGIATSFGNQWKVVPNGNPFGQEIWAHSADCAYALARRMVDSLYGLEAAEVVKS